MPINRRWNRFSYWILLVAPQGFEPRYDAPEASVLPLNEGAIRLRLMYCGAASGRFDSPALKSIVLWDASSGQPTGA